MATVVTRKLISVTFVRKLHMFSSCSTARPQICIVSGSSLHTFFRSVVSERKLLQLPRFTRILQTLQENYSPLLALLKGAWGSVVVKALRY